MANRILGWGNSGGGFWDADMGQEDAQEPAYSYTLVEPGGEGHEEADTYRTLIRSHARAGDAHGLIVDEGEFATMEAARAHCERHAAEVVEEEEALAGR